MRSELIALERKWWYFANSAYKQNMFRGAHLLSIDSRQLIIFFFFENTYIQYKCIITALPVFTHNIYGWCTNRVVLIIFTYVYYTYAVYVLAILVSKRKAWITYAEAVHCIVCSTIHK